MRTEVRTTYTLPNELAGQVGMEGKGLAGMGLIYRESLATCTRALHGEAVRQEMRTTLPNVFGKDDPDWNLAQQLLHTTLVHEGVHEAEHLPGKRGEERRGAQRESQ